MSATRDKNQRVTFVYSNLYQIYRKGKEAAVSADPEAVIAKYKAAESGASTLGLSSGKVLKAKDLNVAAPAESPQPAIAVRAYEPVELIGKRLPKPASLATLTSAHHVQNDALNSLKQNLNALNDLHSRLRFMLQELEDLVKEE
jgi:hypothetical protein